MVFVCSEGVAFTEDKTSNVGGCGGLGGGPGCSSVTFSCLVVEALS